MMHHVRPLPCPPPAEQTMAMPVTRQWTTAAVRELTREDCAWPRHELIDGELLVTPAPRSLHQFVIQEFVVLLYAYLECERVGVVLASPSDLELRPGTITQPDVFVVPRGTPIAGDIMEWPDVNGLLLAIEVLSPGSQRTDRVVKRDFYLANGVAEYWIVDNDARVLERWRPMQGTPELRRDAVSWAPPGGDSLVIDLQALFDRAFEKVRLMARG